MRILSVIHYPTFGGPHNRTLRLAPVLAEKGVSTTVLLPDEPGNAAARFRDRGVDLITRPLHRLRKSAQPWLHAAFALGVWSEISAIRRIIRERSIDLVQVNGLIHPQGAIAARLEGAAVVWMLIDKTAPAFLRRAMMSLVTRFADVAMVAGRELIGAHPGVQGLGDRVIPFFPPVDTAVFRPDPARRIAARAQLGFDADDVVIGTVGNLYPAKDQLTFVRAAAALRRVHPRTRFLILGQSYPQYRKYTNALWEEAARLGLRVGKDLIHHEPGARIPDLAPAFDVFWLTSADEGAPTAMEEAMAVGLPVVASSVGSIPEMLGNGTAGQVIAPGDFEGFAAATARLLQAPALRAGLGERARRLALERFAIESCAETHLRSFAAALSHSRARNQLYPASAVGGR